MRVHTNFKLGNMAARQEGYYSVKCMGSNWRMAEWNGDKWFLTGMVYAVDTDQLTQIDETRILMPDEETKKESDTGGFIDLPFKHASE